MESKNLSEQFQSLRELYQKGSMGWDEMLSCMFGYFLERAREFKSNRAGPAYQSLENYNQGCIDVQHEFFAFLESLVKEVVGE